MSVPANGMYINSQRVTKLSGPISLYYMKPNEKAFIKFSRVDLQFPLLLLFGDVHDNVGICPNTFRLGDIVRFRGENPLWKIIRMNHPYQRLLVEKIVSKEVRELDNDGIDRLELAYQNHNDSTYRIYDESFSRLLDTLGTINPRYPVDFYTETFDYHLYHEQYEKNIPITKFIDTNKRCIESKPLRSQSDECFSPNIRWQSADIRANRNDPIYLFNQLLVFILRAEYYIDNYQYQPELYTVLNDIDMEYHTLLTNYHVTEFLQNMIVDGRLNIQGSVEYLFDLSNQPDKSIYKQIKKQTFPLFNDSDFWKRIMVQMVRYYFSIQTGYEWTSINQHPYYQKIVTTLLGNLSGISSFNGKERSALEMIKIAISCITDSFVSFYSILRIFKHSSKKNGPTLVMGYLGNYHCKGIIHMLGLISEAMGETLYHQLSIENERGNKCITFSQVLDLSADVERHSKLRDDIRIQQRNDSIANEVFGTNIYGRKRKSRRRSLRRSLRK